MNTLALGMSAVGFMTVLGTWVIYLSTVPRGKVPRWPSGSIILQSIGIFLAISAIILGFQTGVISGVSASIPAAPTLLLGLLFLWLLTQRKTPIGNLKVKVGDRILPFEAVTSEGVAFHTNELAGKRVLLKFYRGGW